MTYLTLISNKCGKSVINDYFGTKQTSVGQKSAQIRQMLKLSRYWDKDFSTKQQAEDNPFNNLMMINGFIVTKDLL